MAEHLQHVAYGFAIGALLFGLAYAIVGLVVAIIHGWRSTR